MMRSGIDLEAAAQPVGAKLIRAQTWLNEDTQTLEEATRTGLVRIQCTCAQLGTEPTAHLSGFIVR